MGIDMGFDRIPRLEKTCDDDLEHWSRFMSEVAAKYENDRSFDMGQSGYVEFCVGEHPMLPYEGHNFLRFSSKISGSHGSNVEEYIRGVFRLAKAQFGERVRLWHESFEDSLEGTYDWDEVNESIRSFTVTKEAKQDEYRDPKAAEKSMLD
jgi:hypothetical protein